MFRNHLYLFRPCYPDEAQICYLQLEPVDVVSEHHVYKYLILHPESLYQATVPFVRQL